jgi:hypothetical protein
MRFVSKWWRLPAARRSALREALAAVTFVRLSLGLLPWRMWEGVGASLPRARKATGEAFPTPGDIAWAVRRVSRAVPGATCLTQALAAQLLLSRRGYASQLRIGVTRASRERLRAHAWLESDGLILIGGAGIAAYTPLSTASRAGETSLSGILVR